MAELIDRSLKYYPNVSRGDVRIIVLEFADKILSEMPEKLRSYALAQLEKRGVEIRLNTGIAAATGTQITTTKGDMIDTRTIVATIGNAPAPVVNHMDLPLTQGRIAVARDLSVPGRDGVWSLGDCALIPMKDSAEAREDFAPPTAQFAVREAKQLAAYRSEFFGKLREVLENREGVRIVGDRFVFSSEVLFPVGAVDLSATGKSQIARVARILEEVAEEIPDDIDWVVRVDGHTDDLPLSSGGKYADNWELSQGRALSVVRFLTEELGFDANRLVAAGFGEYHPVNLDRTAEARAQNRRIELKLTEK